MWLASVNDDENTEQDEASSDQDDRDTDEGLGAFLTVDEVAEMLRINKSTVYRMAKEGRIPATRVGRQWRFRQKALEGFFDAGGELANEERGEDLKVAAEG